VDLTEQPARDREGGEAGETVFEGLDVIGDLPHGAMGSVAGLGVEDVGERRPGPFDPAAGEGLTGDVGLEQEVRVGEQSSRLSQPAEGSISLGEPQPL